MSSPRVILLADQTRADVAPLIATVRQTIAAHATLTDEFDTRGNDLPDACDANLAVVVGGDGTLLSQSRRLLGHGIPLVGVNIGRLGFLAEFDVDSLAAHASVIFGPNPPIRSATVLNVQVNDTSPAVALNDAAVTAGRPFRMIELGLSPDGQEGPVLNGDGVIVSTPVGSTAYNVSAGGPIVHPSVDAIVVTPMAAHSLAFRPVVLPCDTTLRITVNRANEGTTLVLDGQTAVPLSEGDVITIRRDDRETRLVTNPTTTYWHILLEKMRWAAPPNYRDRGL